MVKQNFITKTGIVHKLGGSFYLLLDKDLRTILELEKGEMVGFNVWNIQAKTIKCKECNYTFQSYLNKEEITCPSCGEIFNNTTEKEVKQDE